MVPFKVLCHLKLSLLMIAKLLKYAVFYRWMVIQIFEKLDSKYFYCIAASKLTNFATSFWLVPFVRANECIHTPMLHQYSYFESIDSIIAFIQKQTLSSFHIFLTDVSIKNLLNQKWHLFL